ncbi:hypothetical protein EDC18_102321 [Natranaerovirga pectinivora]|uniref:Uncharacterized protein n=1 Tax=Natranaerovirga pectinivora TaxID=682400 RepID=A0A4R3MTC1_9FIRM|nr:hypothetical protein [Natranaerovirga pectinivora]TCT16304.1 hypothetical protein EDC18_102321 [Natranaerovirga pectinivora]
MKIEPITTCPICKNNELIAKHEATYVYSYKLENDPNSTEEFIPFLFDTRDHLTSNQYIECPSCNTKFSCEFGDFNKGINMTILQKAIRTELVESPDFLG